MVATGPARPHRLIAFSLYGDAPLYLRGAVENARLAPLRYPGWTARFYVSQEIPADLIAELQANGAETVAMTRRTPDDGMFWRLLAADEPAADAVIFRDADSRLSDREVAAVDEWLESGRRLHLMRDHWVHRAPIMGGMWGIRPGVGPGRLPAMPKLIRRWRLGLRLGYERELCSNDQTFLRAMVYPIARRDAMVHSEYTYFRGEKPRPFPRPARDGEFVGQIVDPDGVGRPGPPTPPEARGLMLAPSPPRYDPLSWAARRIRRKIRRGVRRARRLAHEASGRG